MAKKRMFSLSVVDTDKFLEMPISSRLLYYELGMRADDDGFVDNWKKILLFTGLKEDDMKILISKQFIIPFESGIIVIRHWRLNNYLRNDRFNPTQYQHELSQLQLDDSGTYSLSTTGIPDGIHSIDKISIDKNSIDNIYAQMFEEFFSQYPKKKEKKGVKEWFLKKKPSQELFKIIIEALNNQKKSYEWLKDNGKYIPYPTTWLNKERWNDEVETKQTPEDILAKLNEMEERGEL